MSEPSYPNILIQTTGTDHRADFGENSTTEQSQLTDRMAQSAHHTIDRLAEAVGPQIERVEGAIAGAAGNLRDQARLAREKGDEWADGLRATVRRNPLSALATAIAVGALIARITR